MAAGNFDFALAIGGEAGQGIATPGNIMARLFIRRGLHLNAYNAYRSLVQVGLDDGRLQRRIASKTCPHDGDAVWINGKVLHHVSRCVDDVILDFSAPFTEPSCLKVGTKAAGSAKINL